MARRRRGVRVLKWLGTGLCVLIAAAFVVSVWWNVGYSTSSIQPVAAVAIERGALVIWLNEFNSTELAELVRLRQAGRLGPDGWLVDRRAGDFGTDWLWPMSLYDQFAGFHPDKRLTLPLWIPFLALLLPTLLFWYLDRRRPLPGRCRRCNYDLTGNLSGVCPECGAAAQSESHAG